MISILEYSELLEKLDRIAPTVVQALHDDDNYFRRSGKLNIKKTSKACGMSKANLKAVLGLLKFECSEYV